MIPTMQTFESEYGREPISVDDRTPTFFLDWYLDRIHVGTSDDDIRDDILGRIERSEDTFSDSLKDDTIRYALWRHAENRAYLSWVMGSH